MEITLYKSKLCPRCAAVARYLRDYVASKPDTSLVEIDILSSPLKSWAAGIRMIPTVEVNGESLSFVIPSREKITDFLDRHASGQKS